MAVYNAHAPHHHHFAVRISSAHALSLLSSYLEAASAEACYHSNTLLTANGAITSAAGAQNLGLVLHNLKRVQAGLRGEELGADLIFEEFGEQRVPELMPTQNGFQGSLPEGLSGVAKGGDGVERGWQDRTEFERQQDIVQGENGKRHSAIGQGRETRTVPRVEATDINTDREERKRRKKQRRRQERDEAENMRNETGC